MYISKIKVKNYKSFLESEELNLVPGFNLIVGQNNAGKTALLKALSLKFNNKPHRSEKTVPRPEHKPEPNSKVNISFTISKKELNNILRNYEGDFMIPKPDDCPSNNEAIQKFKNTLVLEENTLRAVQDGNNNVESTHIELYESVPPTSTRYHTLRIALNDVNFSYQGDANHSSLPSNHYGLIFAERMKNKIYMFDAERLTLSDCAFGTGHTLTSNASNLAEVLNNLKSNPVRYQRFNDAVKFIFPQIKHVDVESMENKKVEIKIWTVELDSERKDLSVQLSESGTGIGQVLAILYVVLNADSPTVMIIDEPQSFLHPGAARKLIEVLKVHPQHQYIISTHSPTIVSACNSNNIILVKNEAGESKTELVNSGDIHSLKLFLADVGVKLSDIFGADNILWVEGKTEEICFPMIFGKSNNMPKSGVEILGVKQTGDFEGKHKKTAFDIYKRLSKGRSLLPPAIGFIFDQEGRTKKDMDDLTRQSEGTVTFLPRRLYENYLLNPRAIAEVTTAIDGFRDTSMSESEVAEWIESKKWERKYFKRKVKDSDKSDAFWNETAHGAKLLEDIFAEFSETRVPYNKTTHSVELTKWLLENEPSDLDEITELLNSTLC